MSPKPPETEPLIATRVIKGGIALTLGSACMVAALHEKEPILLVPGVLALAFGAKEYIVGIRQLVMSAVSAQLDQENQKGR